MEIAHSVLVGLLSYKEAADLHWVKPALVQGIMSKWKKDPEYLSKRRQKLQDKADNIEQVHNYAERLLANNRKITSAQSVAEGLNEYHGTKLTARQVQLIMSRQLGLKYKRLILGAPEA